jgi:hypothetical protein
VITLTDKAMRIAINMEQMGSAIIQPNRCIRIAARGEQTSTLSSRLNVFFCYPTKQYSGTMTFWSGSGSADPDSNPDSNPDSDPPIFLTDLQDANKKTI